MDTLEAYYDNIDHDDLEEPEDVDEDDPGLWSPLTSLEMGDIAFTDTPIMERCWK